MCCDGGTKSQSCSLWLGEFATDNRCLPRFYSVVGLEENLHFSSLGDACRLCRCLRPLHPIIPGGGLFDFVQNSIAVACCVAVRKEPCRFSSSVMLLSRGAAAPMGEDLGL